MPISIPPTNTTPGTAYVLNGHTPLDATIDLRGLANPQRVWFTYTLGASDFGLATSATFEPAVGSNGFRPKFQFRANDPLATPYQSGTQYPVEAFTEAAVGMPRVGDTVYISLENGYVGSYAPTTITSLAVQVSPNTTIPIGSPIINNDIAGDPMTLVTPTGEPTQLRSFPGGESAANLVNGVSLWSEKSSNLTLHLYDAELFLLTNVTWNRGHLRAPIASNRIDTFYVATRSLVPAKITTISQTGVLGPTEWSPTGFSYTTGAIYHAAPSWVNTDIIYLYAFFYNSPTSSVPVNTYGVSKFHKSTHIVDPVFIDADDPNYNFGGFYGNEFLELPGESFLLMFRWDTDSKVKFFDASGALVRTFVIPNADLNRIAYDGATYSAFWTWSFTKTNFDSHFIKFRISDGAILADFTLPTTSSGTTFSSYPASSTANLFGVPESCPLLTPPVELPPYGLPGPPGPEPAPPPEELPPYVAPSYDLDARYIRRLRRAPHLDTEHVRIFYKKFELDLERGVGLATGGDPIVMLRLSRDGGHTWSEPVLMGAGRMGEYTKRVIARRLGHAREDRKR